MKVGEWDEARELRDVEFRFAPTQAPSSAALSLVSSLHDLPTEHLLDGYACFFDFVEELLRRFRWGEGCCGGVSALNSSSSTTGTAGGARTGKPSQLTVWTSLARVSGGDGGGVTIFGANNDLASPKNVSWASSKSPRPTSSFAMRDSPHDGTSKTRSSKMACGGNTGIGFTHSALAEAAKRRTSVDCMLPRPHHRESGAAPAPRRPGRGALSGARGEQRETERRGVQIGELNML